MSEAPSGVGITRGIALEVRVVLGAVVVSELEDALPVQSVGVFFLRGLFSVAVIECEEVQGEVAEFTLYLWC